MKQTSWILALIVGLVVGVVGDRMAGGGGRAVAQRKPAEQQQAQRPTPPPARPQEDPKAVYKVPVDDSPVRGPADALVTIVESSDFECPFCKRVGPTLKQLEETFPGKIRFTFKHNPLPFHAKAMPSAVAAEEARAQGGAAKFWAMHDKLFESAPSLDRASLEKAAQELGLDMAGFKKALDENRHEARIRRDQALVNGLGATGTPSFFINGRKVTGAQPFENFRVVVEEELKKAEALTRSGVAAKDVYAKIIENGATAPVMLPAPAGGAAPAAPPPPPPAVAAKVSFRPDDPSRGPQAAPVTIVLFSDFQCPFCSRVEPTLAQLIQAYPSDVRIVWKHQPLPFHPNAMPAAIASEAAREQGKFWQMHDLMFQNQQQLSPANYEAWARQIGLDGKKFQAALNSPTVKSRIEEDSRQGNQVGANGTPTSFVNCRQVVGALPYDAFKKIVDEEIARAAQMRKAGVAMDAGFYDRICDENVKGAKR